MRKFITLIAIGLSLTMHGQQSQKPRFLGDTVAVKKDTVTIVIYIIEKTDTSKLTPVLYEGRHHRVYKKEVYYITKQQVATRDGKTFEPISEPVTIGVLDDKKRPIKDPTKK